MIKNTKIKICFTSLLLLFSLFSYAGPPFNTDDPAPVDYKHWNFMLHPSIPFSRTTDRVPALISK